MSTCNETKMDRKAFLSRVVGAGLACCGAACAQALSGQAGEAAPPPAPSWVSDLERRMIRGAESPGTLKAEKAEFWIKALMEHMDGMLDLETRRKLLEACGRSCLRRAYGVATDQRPPREDLDRFLRSLEAKGTPVTREGDTVTFTYSWGRSHQNPWGLTIRDGYCMCPLVESGPPGLSPTFCYCSTGYVRESVERATGLPVRVELLESLKGGGKDCVFRVTISGVKA